MKYPQLVSMPSAVSDWLEEQLEARGIDSVVYTRYVLSLLHRDPVDIICSEQDPQFISSNKEVKRSGGNRKRHHSAAWWKLDQAVADKLKRSAAVECLMSASDQKCGIESLVDELCEKLKEINQTSTSSQETSCKNDSQFYQTSPQDSARKYYAAFPPLSRNSATGSPDRIVTLVPKWFGSPKKKNNRKVNRSSGFEDKLRCKFDAENMKARNVGKRLAYLGRNKREFGYCRNITKSMECPDNNKDWSLYMLNNSKSRRTSSSWPQTVSSVVDNHMSSTEEQCLEMNHSTWENDEDINMYDDLPVDIRELLDSPVQQDDTVEMMNLANMRDTGNKTFISCGTNITSSIWSNDANMVDVTYDNNYNNAMDASQNEMLTNLKFASVSNNNKLRSWSNSESNIIAENETNFFFEALNSNNYSFATNEQDTLVDVSWQIPVNYGKIEKWSEEESCDSEMEINTITKSFMKLNHNREESSFTEVFPKTAKTTYSIFSNSSNMLHLTIMRDNDLRKIDSEKDKVDLLTSSRSHFRPITDKIEKHSNSNYIDGTTFIIPSGLETLPYKRSDSGMMYLECEYGIKKKYSEYKMSEHCISSGKEFVLKFNVCENNKACQTDSVGLIKSHCENGDVMEKVDIEQEDFYFPGDQHELVDDTEKHKCTCVREKENSPWLDYTIATKLDGCQVHCTSPNIVNEITWKSESMYCENCNSNKLTWGNNWLRKNQVASSWNKQLSNNIWNGGEVCLTCLGLTNGRPPPSVQQNQLREDISQDGEQLLSDLSSLQKSYMEQLPVNEITCNISEMISTKEDSKRRHSFISETLEEILPVHRGSWSFASHLEEECIIQMSTIPTLRSVTL